MDNTSILYLILPFVFFCAVCLLSKMKKNFGLYLGVVVFFGGGCLIFYNGCKDFFDYHSEVNMATQSQSWPTTDAVITTMGHRTRSIGGPRHGKGPSRELYILAVSYNYEVHGAKYTSERIHPYYEFDAKDMVVRNGMYCQRSQETVVAQLKAKGKEMGIESGKKIAAHYNPQRPEESTLLVGEMGDGNRVKLQGSIVLPIMGFVFWSASLVLAWIICREKRNKITIEKT